MLQSCPWLRTSDLGGQHKLPRRAHGSQVFPDSALLPPHSTLCPPRSSHTEPLLFPRLADVSHLCSHQEAPSFLPPGQMLTHLSTRHATCLVPLSPMGTCKAFPHCVLIVCPTYFHQSPSNPFKPPFLYLSLILDCKLLESLGCT